MAGQNTNLRVQITADIQDIKKGLGLVISELGRVRQAANSSAPNMAGWSKGIAAVRQQLTGLVGAYVGLQSIGAAVRGVFDAFDRMDRVEELTHIVRLSAEEWSKWIYTAKFAGVEAEKLKTAFFTFEAALGKNKAALEDLGVTAPTTQGKLLQIADAFAKLEDSQYKVEIARKLFGKGAADLLPILSQGSAAINDMGAEAERTGNAFDKAGVESAAAFNDNLDALKGTMQGVFNVTAQQLAPAMGAYAAAANEGAKESNLAADAGSVLANVFKGVVFAAVLVKNAIEAVSNVIGAMVESATAAARALAGSFGSILTTIGNSFKALVTGGPLSAAATFSAGITNSIKVSKQGMEQFRATAARARATARDGIKSAISDVSDAFAMFDKRAADSAGKSQASARNRAAEIKAALEKAALEAALAGEGGAGKPGNAASGGRGVATLAEAKEQGQATADVLALALDQADRDLAALAGRFEDGMISIADFFQQRAALEQEVIDLKLLQLQAELDTATSLDQQVRALTEIERLQRDRAEIGPRAAKEQAKAEKEAARAAQQARDEANAGTAEAADQVRNLGTESIRGFFTDMIDGTVKFKDAFKEMVRNFAAGLAEMAAQALAKNIAGILFGDGKTAGTGGSNGGGLLSGFVSFLGGLFGGGSAKGNIFSASGMQKFAKGAAFGLAGISAFAHGGAFTNSVVDSPQLFAFGQGGQFGVMGEAGPEAVMPLTRGADGNLGVRAQGAGGASRVTTPIVVLGDRAVADALASTAGRDVVITHVMASIDKIRGAL